VVYSISKEGAEMRLSTRSRYSVRALVDIICNGGESEAVPLSRIAVRQDVSEKYLEQLFIILRRGGIVKSVRGVKGGYVLTKSPEEIFLGDILRLMELDIQPVSCDACDKIDNCMSTYCWQGFGKVIMDYVDSISLKDICEGRFSLPDVHAADTVPSRKEDIIEEIEKLKKKRNAVLFAHNYQRAEIQEIADHIGDSLDLSRRAATLKKDTIVFSGVKFMAESAKVLSPQKTVLLPRMDAGCPMADMITAEELREMKQEYPRATVVCYVNTSVEVKAESDVCCTSANAVKIVNHLGAKQVIFVPDRNLAHYVSRFTQAQIIPWHGYCYVHEFISLESIKEQKRLHPEARVLVHPETKPEVVDFADHVLSTNGMVKMAKGSKAKEFIIGTEEGLVARLRRENPAKKFYLPRKPPICSNMKKTRLIDIYRSLKGMKYPIEIEEEVIDRARDALDKMIAVR
jgi:quinolinate synthase